MIAMIEPGSTGTVTFVAPGGGSYLYVDPYKAPLYRVLGLHGAFIVDPIDGNTLAGSPTPFSQPSTRRKSRPCSTHWAATASPSRARNGNRAIPTARNYGCSRRPTRRSTPASRRVNRSIRQRWWTTSCRAISPSTALSGFDASHDHGDMTATRPSQRIIPKGKQGEPCLIRTMNAGLATHSVHIHGNHCMECSETDDLRPPTCAKRMSMSATSWMLAPLGRIDMILPFERPPDIPRGKWPPREEDFPLKYVMHCHYEMSQTAGGGNYPQGAVTHWEMTGALLKRGRKGGLTWHSVMTTGS